MRFGLSKFGIRLPGIFALAVMLPLSAWSCEARADDVSPVAAQGTQVPGAYRNVGVTEHLNAQLPTDLKFYDEAGQDITLGQLLKPDRPIILQLGYLGCPMLCDTIARSLVDSANKIDLKIGKDFDYVFVSIDPTDTPTLATLKRNSYAAEYDKPGSLYGFHILVGRQKEIDALASAVGFRYQTAPNGQFAHPAVAMIITPEGKISRYLYGVTFPEQTLRLSLVEASHEKIGSSVDEILLICLHWDPTQGKYSMTAMNMMRVGGVLTIMCFGSAIFWMSRKHSRTEVDKGQKN
jgi:protein SCO1